MFRFIIFVFTASWNLRFRRQVPPAGWCKTRHSPLKPAQSGYNGYCKGCFVELFPDEHRVKQERRKKVCRFCGVVAELLGGAACRPCHRALSCKTCKAPHPAERPPQCIVCHSATALWCTRCHPEASLAAKMCEACQEKISSCYYCHGMTGDFFTGASNA